MNVKYLVGKPFSIAWETIYRLRRFMYSYGILKSAFLKIPVISVGNLTFGGAGKTPFTIWLANYFSKEGKKPLILSRGYKGKLEKTAGLLLSKDRFRLNPVEYGDEPTMMARKMKTGAVVIGSNRVRNFKFYFKKVLPDIVLLDDGFQHLQLFRNLNIVLFDALVPVTSYQVAPLGYLREGLTSLGDADVLVITRADQVSSETLVSLKNFFGHYINSNCPIVSLRYISDGLYNCVFEKVHELSVLSGKKVISFVAIASPHSFYNMINEFGAEIIEKYVYPDHYFFSLEDIQNVLAKASSLGAIILTTEKDMVKIKRLSLDKKFMYINIDIDFIEGQESLIKVINENV